MISHVETGCLLPFFQSLITGALVGLIAAGAATWMELSNPPMLGLIAGAIGSLWWWISSIHLWRLDTYAIPDYMLPEPEPVQATSSTVRVEVVNDNQIAIADLDVPAEKIAKAAKSWLSGVPFAEDTCKPLTRNQFHHVRTEFIGRGWARWRSDDYPQQGVELSPSGKAVCREIVRQHG